MPQIEHERPVRQGLDDALGLPACDLGASDQSGRVEVALQADSGQDLTRPIQGYAAIEADAIGWDRLAEPLIPDAGAARKRNDRHVRIATPSAAR